MTTIINKEVCLWSQIKPQSNAPHSESNEIRSKYVISGTQTPMKSENEPDAISRHKTKERGNLWLVWNYVGDELPLLEPYSLI